MNQLGLIIKNEYLTDIRSKTFWIGTILTPILIGAFSIFVGYMVADSEVSSKMANPAAPDPDEMSGIQVMGMLSGILLAIFLMIYGAQIFAKVKKEKVNRVMEVLATCVTGRTMMLSKIISVFLLGATQILIWLFLICSVVFSIMFILGESIPLEILTDSRFWLGLMWTILFFIGGYCFYGSIYAACGAMTDKDNENQSYMTIITFMLLGSFYIGEFAIMNSENPFIIFCSYFPFTSPTIAAVNAVAGSVSFWLSLSQLLVLYIFAYLSIGLSGKIYTSSILMKGKKFTPKDIMVFLKTK